MRRLALALVAGAVVLATSSGGAEATVEFVDGGPGVIDLDSAGGEVGNRWAVTVVDGRAERDRPLAAFLSPALSGVVRIDRIQAVGDHDDGTATVAIVLELDRAREAEGDLIVFAGDTAPLRRRIRVVRTDRLLLAPAAVTLHGVRPVPFVGTIDVDPIALGPGSGPDRRIIVGTVAAPGDTGTILLDGARLDVLDVDDVGSYEGTARLPGGSNDGGPVDVAVTVHARDAIGWPVLALMVGLAGTGLLEHWRRRERPRLALERGIGNLKERSDTIRRSHEVRAHITRARADLPALVLDEESLRLLQRFDADDGREPAPTEDRLKPLEDVVSRYEKVADALSDAEVAYRRIVNRASAADQEHLNGVLDRSPLGSARAIEGIRTTEKLADAERAAMEAEAYVLAFEQCELLVRRVRAKAQSTPHEQAADQLFHRLLAGEDLAAITEEATGLDRRLLPAHPAGTAPPPAAAAAADDTVALPEWAGATGTVDRRAPSAPRRLWPSLAAVAVAALFALAAISSVLNEANDIGEGPPSPAPTSVPELRGTDVPPELPTALVVPSTTPAGGLPLSTLGWSGLAIPIALGVAMSALLWWLARLAIRRARTSVAMFGNWIRRADSLVGIVAGVLAVGTGLTVLYAPDPGFGTAGDYGQALLWGTVVGEGAQIVRRFLPGQI